MNRVNNNKVKSSDIISTVVGAGTRVKGAISIKNSGRIDGYVDGGVTSDEEIVVGEGGAIEGHVVSKRVIVGGKVIGSITAKNKVILEEKAWLEGDIKTKSLRIANGAHFKGKVCMLEDAEKEKGA